MRIDSEAALESETARLFEAVLGWNSVQNVQAEVFGPAGTLGRKGMEEVLLHRRLRPRVRALNPDLPLEAIEAAIETLSQERSSQSLVAANQDVHSLLRDGVTVRFLKDDDECTESVQLIDWEHPAGNDWFLATQFWVAGPLGRKRIDFVGFVNGIPLLLGELKASHKRVENAYRLNLSDYKSTVPQLFWFNALIVLSNGRYSRIGTVTSSWEHFSEWKRISNEGETGVISLDTLLRGTCEPRRFLDLVENFIVFSNEKASTVKILAKNHQYLGVNNAIEAVKCVRQNAGRLGVFWHTQGSGKSYSMVFFSRKVLRKLAGHWTFLVVTDRLELDDQIYGVFQRTATLTRERVQAETGAHLQRLLREDNRFVFTLIQKFRTEMGETYPTLSERDDIIVMTDEAHRTQYDILAKNMHDALPNAAFLGFTGTPLMAGEEKTREVFGDYVSVYNFAQAIEDGSTVPLYYENRIPELQLTNDSLNEDMENLLDEAMLDEEQEKKLERQFAREYHLITRNDRLEKIAEDIVEHFMTRGVMGKAMVVSIDKATAVRMYNKFQKYWEAYLERLEMDAETVEGAARKRLEVKLQFMRETDMAVVVSQSQNEVEEFDRRSLDIRPHRRRMVREKLDEKFKDADDKLRIVFLCAMWMTGFDAPSVSTLYLDKPMKNHTLMQTIARANRVWGDKAGGLIVDYIGVFRNLQRALAIYGTNQDGSTNESPVEPKSTALLQALDKASMEARRFLERLGVEVEPILAASTVTERIRLLEEAYDKLLVSDAVKREFLTIARRVDRLYRTTLPADYAEAYAGLRAMLVALQGYIESNMPEIDITDVMADVEKLLDRSISTRVDVEGSAQLTNLSDFDFEELKERFEEGRKRVEAEKLRGAVSSKARQLARLNRQRLDYLQRLQKLIDEYNAGSYNVEEFFRRLVALAQELTDEEQRAVREELSEEELAVFDLLLKPEVELSPKERKTVKSIARELLERLKQERLVLDWRKSQQYRAAVRVAIEEKLDELPEAYDRDTWRATCEDVYQHVFKNYYGAGQGVYAAI